MPAGCVRDVTTGVEARGRCVICLVLSRIGFSGSADRMALFSVRSNSNKGGVGKTSYVIALGPMHQYLENGTRCDQSYY